MNRMRVIKLGLAAVLIAGPASAQPTVAFDNLAPGGGYDTNTSWVVNGPDVEYADERLTHGMRFTAERSGRVERIDLGIGMISGTNAARVQLWSADENGLLGQRLITWSVADAVPPYGLNFEATPFESDTLGPNLAAGSDYWIVPIATGDTDFGWYFSADAALTAPIVNIRPFGVRNYSTDRQGAVRVIVPAPAAVCTLPVGAALMSSRRRR